MRSGYDFNDGNYDSGNLVRIEPPGLSFSNANSTWVLLDADGPGVLTSIWFTGKNKQGEAFIGGRLSFFFDGESTPRISENLPELLEGGDIFPKPLAEKSSGGWTSYVPIAFGRSLKITLSEHRDLFTHRKNGRGDVIPHLYHQFTFQKLEQAPPSARPQDLSRIRPWQADRRGTRSTTNLALASTGAATVFTAQGKGILNALRMRCDGLDLDQVRLRVTADGIVTLNLSVPEFWGFSPRSRPAAKFESLLLGQDADGFLYSLFPMPHRTNFVVAIENQGPAGTVWVETTHLPQWLEPEHFHFHSARVTDKTEKGRDIKLLETNGRGHYVGAILELANATLEGDDRFFVDGERFPPRWHGTGTEDYFRCGWYFHGGPLTRPLYGLLDNGSPKIAYRFHVADRVNFTRSVCIGFEHGHRNAYLGPYRGTVYWYSEN